MSGRRVVFRSVLEVLLSGDLCFSAAVPADGCCNCSVALSRLRSRKCEWRSAGPRSACLKAGFCCRGSLAEAGAASGRSCVCAVKRKSSHSAPGLGPWSARPTLILRLWFQIKVFNSTSAVLLPGCRHKHRSGLPRSLR